MFLTKGRCYALKAYKSIKWNGHIGKITSKGNNTHGFLKRNLRVSSKALKEKAYMALLRPKLEYCSTVWDPRDGIENKIV